MAMVYNRHQIGIRDTGFSVSVPDDCAARLMYYLDCMCGVLNLDNKGYDLERLTDYQNYDRLTIEEEQVLLLLCMKLSPDVMEGKCIFLNEGACGGKPNKFVSLQAVRTTVAAVDTVVVGKRNVQVKEVMFYKLSWIQAYFLEPLLLLTQRLRRLNLAITSGGSSRASINTNSGSECDCCTIL